MFLKLFFCFSDYSLLAIFLATSLFLTAACLLGWAENYNKMPKYMRRFSKKLNSKSSRIASLVSCVVVLMSITGASILLIINCNRKPDYANDKTDFASDNPEYVVLAWTLCLISTAAVFKLYYLVKLCLLTIMIFIYSILINVPLYRHIFTEKGEAW